MSIIEGKERRKKILEWLANTQNPISGAELAKTFGVSRQVIVQDIALLRANNREILSTNKGYLMFHAPGENAQAQTVIMVKHSSEEIFDEFSAILELGGRILDVSVDHDYYGQIQIDLVINDLNDAREFVRKMKESHSKPLKCLTGDVHYHTISAASEKVLQLIRTELKNRGYLLEED